jgi:hypothetical protein
MRLALVAGQGSGHLLPPSNQVSRLYLYRGYIQAITPNLTPIAQRVAIAESSGGHTVFEVEPNTSLARDLKSLAKDVLNLSGAAKW